MPLPIYIEAPPGARPDTLTVENLADSVQRLESVGALGPLDELEAGLVLADRDSVDEADILALADRNSRRGRGLDSGRDGGGRRADGAYPRLRSSQLELRGCVVFAGADRAPRSLDGAARGLVAGRPNPARP